VITPIQEPIADPGMIGSVTQQKRAAGAAALSLGVHPAGVVKGGFTFGPMVSIVRILSVGAYVGPLSDIPNQK